MARPVITTDVPGCRAVVDAGATGLLCAPQDASDLAAACLNFLSLSRQAQVEMGKSGRRKMEQQYSQDMVIAAYSSRCEIAALPKFGPPQKRIARRRSPFCHLAPNSAGEFKRLQKAETLVSWPVFTPAKRSQLSLWSPATAARETIAPELLAHLFNYLIRCLRQRARSKF